MLPKPRAILVLFVSCWFCSTAMAEWLRDTRAMMGTEIGVELWADDVQAGQRAMDQVFAEVQRLDLMMNPWNPASELARINRDAYPVAVPAPAEIVTVVERALYYSGLTRGAFDISFAAAGKHYDYREGKKPSEQQLQQAQQAIDFRAITLDRAASTIAFARAGMAIDLGGIAKGFAVDRGIDILQRAGIISAVVSAGGDSRILGNLGERPRIIGIRHPRKSDEHIVRIPLQDTAISTSGDYERFFIDNGQRYHHILNPASGESAQGIRSVSVLSARSIDSDALSTSVFVMGVAAGLALIDSLPGVDAIIVDADGRLHYSQELLLSTTP
jgi:FAD:protein FMN transferase